MIMRIELRKNIRLSCSRILNFVTKEKRIQNNIKSGMNKGYNRNQYNL